MHDIEVVCGRQHGKFCDDFILLGRAWAYALAGGGQAGVEHMLKLVESELRVAMALTGVTKIGEIDGSVIDRG